MSIDATGVAFLDRNGTVVAADAGFTSHLGLGPDDPTAALRRRAEEDAPLRALLAGEGPAFVRVARPGAEPVDVRRVPARGGTFLLSGSSRAAERLEHAMRSEGLARIAAGLSHDVKNPLNAMALQIALLTEKLATAAEEASVAAAPHLGALREQIGRVNEVVRRFLDATDPSAPLGFTDVGALLADTVGLFAHEARRRRIALALDAPAGAVRSRSEPGRVGRLVVGLLSRAMAETPDGGRLAARVMGNDGAVELAIEHASGDPDPDLGYYTEVATGAAAALGGGLDLSRGGGAERIVLRLPGNE